MIAKTTILRLESTVSSSFCIAMRGFFALGRPVVFRSLLFTLAAVGFAIVTLQIPRTLGTHDEAWYLMVIRDHVSENGGAWNMLLGFLPDSLMLWRALSLGIRIVACPLLCYGILAVASVKPLEKARLWVPLSIAIVLAADCDPVWVAAYYNLNYLCFSVSFAISAFSGRTSGSPGFVAAFTSGVFAFFLFPVLPTNFPTCTLLTMAVIWWTGRNGAKRIQKLACFLAGMAAGAAIFFGFCESPSEYLEMARNVSKNAVYGSGGHSLKQFVKWIAQGTGFVCFSVLVPAAALAMIRRTPATRRCDLLSVTVLFAIGFGLFAGSLGLRLGGFFAHLVSPLPPEFPWIAACFLILAVPSKCTKADIATLLLCLAIPVALSFGSAVRLETRGRAYLWPLAVAALLRAEPMLSIRARKLASGTIALIVALSFVCSVGQHFGTWIIAEKSYFSHKVVDGASGLRVPPDVRSTLESARSAGAVDVAMQPLNRYCWGYIYALGGRPMTRKFESEYVNWAKLFKASSNDTIYLVATTAEEKDVKRIASAEPSFEIEEILSFRDEWSNGTIYKVTKSDHAVN